MAITPEPAQTIVYEQATSELEGRIARLEVEVSDLRNILQVLAGCASVFSTHASSSLTAPKPFIGHG